MLIIVMIIVEFSGKFWKTTSLKLVVRTIVQAGEQIAEVGKICVDVKF